MKYTVYNKPNYTTDEIIIFSYLLNWYASDRNVLQSCTSDNHDIAMEMKGSMQMSQRLMRISLEAARRLRNPDGYTQKVHGDLPDIMFRITESQIRKAKKVNQSANVRGAIRAATRFSRMCRSLWFEEIFGGFETPQEFFTELEKLEKKMHDHELRISRKRPAKVFFLN